MNMCNLCTYILVDSWTMNGKSRNYYIAAFYWAILNNLLKNFTSRKKEKINNKNLTSMLAR